MAISQLSNDDLFALLQGEAPEGAASPSVGEDKLKKESKRLKKVEGKAKERNKKNNPNPKKREPSTSTVTLHPLAMALQALLSPQEGTRKGKPSEAAEELLTSLPGIDESMAKGLAQGLLAFVESTPLGGTGNETKKPSSLGVVTPSDISPRDNLSASSGVDDSVVASSGVTGSSKLEKPLKGNASEELARLTKKTKDSEIG
jgi:hypothetical protein